MIIFLFFSVPAFADTVEEEIKAFLKTVEITPKRDVVEIQLVFDRNIEFSDFTINNPPRFVIDIKDGRYSHWYRQFTQKDPLLKELRIFHNRNGLRIVAELKYIGPWYGIFWDEKSKTLKMTIHRLFMKKKYTLLAPGIKYFQIRKGLFDGPVMIQALEVEVAPFVEGRKVLEEIGAIVPGPKITLKTAFKKGGLRGFMKVSDLVKQEQAFAGINGGYFAPDGHPLGLLIKDGKLVSAPIYNRTAWGIDKDGRMLMDRVSFKAEVIIKGENYELSGFNRSRYSDELVLYSSTYGLTTGTNQWGIEAVIKNGQVTAINRGNSVIPADGWVLSAHGIYKPLLEKLKVGDKVEINLKLSPDWLKEGIVEAIGGGPRLVEDGIVKISGKEEKFLPDILKGRAPRTAIGITPENNLLMVVVDGRSEYSIGMTLRELAELMISIGASQAMNLDGGKSSTMVIRGRVFNLPSSGEIPVHNSLIIKLD